MPVWPLGKESIYFSPLSSFNVAIAEVYVLIAFSIPEFPLHHHCLMKPFVYVFSKDSSRLGKFSPKLFEKLPITF